MNNTSETILNIDQLLESELKQKFQLISQCIFKIMNGLKNGPFNNVEFFQQLVNETIINTINNYYTIYSFVYKIHGIGPSSTNSIDYIPWLLQQDLISLEVFSRIIDDYGALPNEINNIIYRPDCAAQYFSTIMGG